MKIQTPLGSVERFCAAVKGLGGLGELMKPCKWLKPFVWDIFVLTLLKIVGGPFIELISSRQWNKGKE